MKKTILFAVMMMAVLSANAQLKVDSIGRVGVGSISSGATLNVHGNQYNAINCTSYFADNVHNGIYNYTASRLNGGVCGIYSRAMGELVSDGSTVGIRGEAIRTESSGLCIGVWGHNDARSNSLNRGIGVLGCINKTFHAYLIDTLYAGYFNGLTKVQGNLIVTGNIRGSLLGAAASPSPISQGDLTEGRSAPMMSNALKGLSANTYYHELTDEMIRAMNADNTQSRVLPLDEENLSDEEILAMEEATINSNNEVAQLELSSMEKQILTKQHYGLDADQLEEVFPDLVYENEDGTKSINYVEMVPILVQAINELSAKVETMEGSNTAKKVVTRGTANVDGTEENLVLLSLGQNKPNPFGTTTSIEVSIPDDVQKAFIYVYDLQGKKVDQMDITAHGKQTIQLDASTLCDGMYLYSLIADGKVVETRRMIVEK